MSMDPEPGSRNSASSTWRLHCEQHILGWFIYDNQIVTTNLLINFFTISLSSNVYLLLQSVSLAGFSMRFLGVTGSKEESVAVSGVDMFGATCLVSSRLNAVLSPPFTGVRSMRCIGRLGLRVFFTLLLNTMLNGVFEFFTAAFATDGEKRRGRCSFPDVEGLVTSHSGVFSTAIFCFLAVFEDMGVVVDDATSTAADDDSLYVRVRCFGRVGIHPMAHAL